MVLCVCEFLEVRDFRGFSGFADFRVFCGIWWYLLVFGVFCGILGCLGLV